MSLYDLKPRFQALLRPAVRALRGMGVTPNQVTLAAVALSIACGGAVALFPGRRWPLLLLGPVLLIRMALNAIDGMLAREHGMATPAGAILNELGDVVSDSALYLPLALTPWFPPSLVVIVVLLAVMTEMAGVVAAQIGASRSFRGPMGKSDRAFAMGAVTLLLGAGVPPGRWVGWVLIGMAGLLALTVLNRARGALGELSRRADGSSP